MQTFIKSSCSGCLIDFKLLLLLLVSFLYCCFSSLISVINISEIDLFNFIGSFFSIVSIINDLFGLASIGHSKIDKILSFSEKLLILEYVLKVSCLDKLVLFFVKYDEVPDCTLVTLILAKFSPIIAFKHLLHINYR